MLRNRMADCIGIQWRNGSESGGDFNRNRVATCSRIRKPNGNPTELGKINSGWGDYLFYGFADEEDTHIRFATLIDLKEFRMAYNGHLAVMASEGTAPLSIVEKGNRDGSSGFKIFRYDEFPDGLIARHWNFAGYYGQDSCLQMASGF